MILFGKMTRYKQNLRVVAILLFSSIAISSCEVISRKRCNSLVVSQSKEGKGTIAILSNPCYEFNNCFLKEEIRDSTGKLRMEICRSFQEGEVFGVRDGIMKTYYDSGSLKEVSAYINGELSGHVMRFYENGELEFIEQSNGSVFERRSYYGNGKFPITNEDTLKLKQYGIFYKGKEFSRTEYDETGNITKDLRYPYYLATSFSKRDPQLDSALGSLVVIYPNYPDYTRVPYLDSVISIPEELRHEVILDWTQTSKNSLEIKVKFPSKFNNFPISVLFYNDIFQNGINVNSWVDTVVFPLR